MKIGVLGTGSVGTTLARGKIVAEPHLPGGPPDVPICGDDAAAKAALLRDEKAP